MSDTPDNRPADPAFVRDLRDRLERDLAAILAPELAAAKGVTTYLILASECTLDMHRDVGGFAVTSSPVWTRPLIADRFRGPGFVVVLNDESIVRARPRRRDLAALLTAIASHEMGHVLDADPAAIARRVVRDSNDPQHTASTSCELVSHWFADEQTNPTDDPLDRAAHGPSWVRMTLHLAARMRALRHCAPDALLWQKTAYGISQPCTFAATLFEEIDSLAHLPLNVVRRTPAPDTFLRLYHADVWLSGVEQETAREYRRRLQEGPTT